MSHYRPRNSWFQLSLGLVFSLVPLSAFAFDACAPDAQAHYTSVEKNPAIGKTLLFRVMRCHVPDNFLFGTMHSDAPEILAKAAPVLARLPQMRSAAFEYLEPEDAARIMQRAMFDPAAKQPLSTQLTTEEWNKLKQSVVRDHGLPEAALERLRPWAASVMLQMPRLEHGGIILDDTIKAAATKRNLPLIGLETMQEQMDIFEGMSQPQQLAMLKDTLSNLPELDAMNRDLERAYRAGDLGHIEKLGVAGFADIADPALKTYLENALLYHRNQRMAERADAELARGGLLIAVGALHLPGKQGILARLEHAGYFIFPVQ